MRLVDQAHAKITPMLKPGDIAIDATAGNGHDTLFLAQQVCPNGLVYAIDVQRCAIKATQERIDGHGLTGLVHMQNGSHSDITSWLPPSCYGKISVVMFNLGYLPGGDRQMITTAQATTTAISKIYPLMRKGGIMSILCYRGHDGGMEETIAVEKLCQNKNWSVEKITGSGINHPILYFVESHQ